MRERYEVAIIGAQGPIAEALMAQLVERRFPLGELSALALDVEDGASIDFAGRPLLLEDARGFDFSQVQLAFLADDAPELVAEAERAADVGVVVIDAVALDWRDSAVPRVVAGVNSQAIAGYVERNLLSSPSRPVVALAPVMQALRQALGDPASLTVNALLPASEFGRAALEDLARETTALLNARYYERQFYPRQIAFNLLPQDADLGVDGWTERERRGADELRALLSLPALAVGLSIVQVPVFYGLSLLVSGEWAASVPADAVREALRVCEGLEVVDSPAHEDAPTPVTDAALSEAVCLSRLRVSGRRLDFWLTADNIRRCAVRNALECADLLIRDYL